MHEFIKQHKEIWSNLLSNYKYNKELTEELDRLDSQKLNKEIFFKIVLWKLNRYPYISDDLIEDLKDISDLEEHSDPHAIKMIGKLLKTRGIGLPMASAILRFLNPNVFQIIDDRAYRTLQPGSRKYPEKPQKITQKNTDKYIQESTKIYFEYLDKIREISESSPACFPFKDADRILYQLDIELGNKIGD